MSPKTNLCPAIRSTQGRGVMPDGTTRFKDKDGNPINERRYLEDSLKREIGFDEDVTARNRIRMMLTAFFKQRDCVGLQRPIIDEASLAKQIEKVPT